MDKPIIEVQNLSKLYTLGSIGATSLRESAEMHRKLYRAIRAHKPKEAHDLMEQYLRMAQITRGLERPTGRKASSGATKERRLRPAPGA